MSSTHAAISSDSGTAWTVSGAWPIADGIWRIPLPLPTDGLQAVNVYVIRTDEGLTLVDGGWAIEVARERLVTSLASIDAGIGDIRSFLVTHVHRDHYTQAVVLRRETGVHVSLGVGDEPSLERLLTNPTVDSDQRLPLLEEAGAAELATRWTELLRGTKRDQTYWELPDTWLSGDQDLRIGTRTLQAISTPGHTQGHYVFREASAGLLFAGDHILPTITPSIGFETEPAHLPLGDFLTSLRKVLVLPDTMLLPAHGPIAPSVHKRVGQLLEHHAHRLDLCVKAIESGAGTCFEVAQALPWTGRNRSFRELDVYNGVLATLETRAHLELLVAQGRATRTLSRTGSDGTVEYGTASIS